MFAKCKTTQWHGNDSDHRRNNFLWQVLVFFSLPFPRSSQARI